jgi:hypothetical protein
LAYLLVTPETAKPPNHQTTKPPKNSCISAGFDPEKYYMEASSCNNTSFSHLDRLIQAHRREIPAVLQEFIPKRLF